MTEDICEIKGCENEATRITATETRYMTVCEDCFHSIYKS